MRRDFLYFWDPTPGRNADHVAEHDVTRDEFAQVLELGFHLREPSRSRPDRWEVEGFTDQARYLIVVFELDNLTELNAWGVTPVTAYEPENPL